MKGFLISIPYTIPPSFAAQNPPPFAQGRLSFIEQSVALPPFTQGRLSFIGQNAALPLFTGNLKGFKYPQPANRAKNPPIKECREIYTQIKRPSWRIHYAAL